MKLAIGRSCTDNSFENIEQSWEDFCLALSKAEVVNISKTTYYRLAKAERQQFKDGQCFICGYLQLGSRNLAMVESRSAITLDVDKASLDFIAKLKDALPYSCAYYTTISSLPEEPRYRVIFPLAEDITAQEYPVVARALAERLGADYVDDCSYRANQLMYYPKVLKDLADTYKFGVQDGPLVQPEAFLAEVFQQLEAQNKEQNKDPLTKSGVVGAFCRAFSISKAIATFLKDMYEPGKNATRYTWKIGSAPNGLWVHEDKWAYSFDATDSISQDGHRVNAFDLVRIQIYGNDRESFNRMKRLALGLKEVQAELAKERAALVEANGWQELLERNQYNKIMATMANYLIILENDEELQGIAYDEFNSTIINRCTMFGKYTADAMTDELLNEIIVHIGKVYGINNFEMCRRAIRKVALDRSMHPIKEFWEGLEWDGLPRLDKLLVDLLGANDTSYTRAVTRKTFVAAVARVYEPGRKFDSALILYGPGGIGKSTLFARMGREWFSDSLSMRDLYDKTGAEKLQGVLIMELSELNGLGAIDLETVKSFITRQDDKYRAPYATVVTKHKRQGILVGTTNKKDFLTQDEGNRRFWPVEVRGGTALTPFNVEATYFEQVWAEAYYRYETGETLYLDEATSQLAEQMRSVVVEQDERIGLVKNYLEQRIPASFYDMPIEERLAVLDMSEERRALKYGPLALRRYFTRLDIQVECFRKKAGDLGRKESISIGNIMKQVSCPEFLIVEKRNGKQRYYERVI